MNPVSAAPVALITGAARRIGAALSRALHAHGYRILIHYGQSEAEAKALCEELCAHRADSAQSLQADLADIAALEILVAKAKAAWGRVDVLINNASRFYSTEAERFNIHNWDDLMHTNVRAPLYLSQSLAQELAKHEGCIVNLVDVYARNPLAGYPLYSISKAALEMLTKSLALELGRAVRVNGIAPGAILWPQGGNSDAQDQVLARTALKRVGDPADICKAALYLIEQAPYVTGQVIAVDGGRSLNL